MGVKAKRRSPLWIKAGAVVILVVLSFAVTFLLTGWCSRQLQGLAVFRVRGVDVQLSPDVHLPGFPAASSYAAASGVKVGHPLLAVDLDLVQKRLEDLPWVKAAHISRRFPDRLLLNIELFEPRALLSAGKLFYLDENGRIFKEVRGMDHKDLPVITGLTEADFKDRPDYAAEGVKQALSLYDTLQSSGISALLASRISEIHLANDIDEQWELSIFLAGTGTEIRLGAAPFDETLRRLAAVQKHTHGRIFQAAVVDLRFKDRMVATPKGSDLEAAPGVDLL